MAKSSARRRRHPAPARDRKGAVRRWLWRLGALLILLALAAGLALWWAARWAPPRSAYPLQGVTIGAANGRVHWGSVRAAGADFAYVFATDGDKAVDPKFERNMRGAREAGIRVGAIHRYSLCRRATDQAANFIRHVPRGPDALPPAIWIAYDANCRERPTRALLLSELATFLAQVEAHMGKRSLIAPGADVEGDYRLTRDIARTSWLRQDFFVPGYGAHPWTMWQANRWLRIAGAEGTVGWNVVDTGDAP